MACSRPGPQWKHADGSSTPLRGCSGTSIGSSGFIRTSPSMPKNGDSSSGCAESRSPTGSASWYADRAGSVS